MAYNLSPFKKDLEEVTQWLSREFSTLRSSQATPAMLDTVRVESYGSFMPLNQVASISLEDSRTIRISPWDTTQIPAIERAIRDADLGLSTVADGKGVRAILPELSSERREQVVKVMKEKLEDARVKVRKFRDETKADIAKKEKDGEIAEDDKFRSLEAMQDIVTAINNQLDEMAKAKEEAIRS